MPKKVYKVLKDMIEVELEVGDFVRQNNGSCTSFSCSEKIEGKCLGGFDAKCIYKCLKLGLIVLVDEDAQAIYDALQEVKNA